MTFPDVSLRPSKSVKRFFGIPFAVIAVASATVPLGGLLGHNPTAVLFSTVLLVTVGASVLLMVPMLLRRGETRRRLLLDRSPVGTAFAGPAQLRERPETVQLSRWQQAKGGLLLVGEEGISYRAGTDPQAPPLVVLQWQDLASVRQRPRTPVQGTLEVMSKGGEAWVWYVWGIQTLGTAIERVRSTRGVA